MKINQHTFLFVTLVVAALVAFTSCQADGDFPGREYMPDMGHPVSYEANTYVYYKPNRWGNQEKYRAWYEDKIMTLKPVSNTIPRGYAGISGTSADEALLIDMQDKPMNGFAPYYYENSDSARALATSEITTNPFPITAVGLAKGKTLYDVYCGVCHGEKADGNGVIYNDGSGPYPVAPANLLSDDFVSASEGRYYHAIMHGKGVMGSYKDKLSTEERWQVIHYIRSLQAKEKDLEYLPTAVGSIAPSNEDDQYAVSEEGMQNDALKKQFEEALNKKAANNNSAPDAEEVDLSIQLENVFFETGSANLKAESQLELNKLAFILNAYPEAAIELSGHTDNVGNPANNLTLSQERANSVRDYLVGKGIDTNRMSAVGFGDTKPVADNATDEGKAKNRRTEFKLK